LGGIGKRLSSRRKLRCRHRAGICRLPVRLQTAHQE
jgi:hypothetical protein